MSNLQKNNENASSTRFLSDLMEKVSEKIITVRGEYVILDADVAALYGVETKRVNEAVRRNVEKFPTDYMFQLDKQEIANLRSQNATSSWGGTRKVPKAFTEKGLYMLATVLKSDNATRATFAIIETFATVRELKRELVELHKETNPKIQQALMKRFGEALTDIVMPDLETSETESSLELNFFIGKIKHTVKRVKKAEKE